MSLVFIHNSVPELYTFKAAIKSDHTVVDYTNDLTEQFVIDTIADKTNLAFVYHFPGYFSLPFFHDIRDISDRLIRPRKIFFSNRLLNLFTEIKNKNGSLTVDLLSCSLNSPYFMDEVRDIENELGIDIRYSVDLTGNKDGNWILESDSVDIKDYYFNADINNWNYVLTGAITMANLANYNPSAFIYDTITKTCTLKRDINMADMSFNNTTQKFNANCYIDLSNNEIFDGSGYKIDVDWENLGLFATSIITDFSSAPLIKKLTVNSNGSIAGSSGGIIRSQQQFFKVTNCYSNGIVQSNGGGICGQEAGAYGGGKCIINNCYFNGEIGTDAGGICGSFAGQSSGICIINYCESHGNIASTGGGICGSFAGQSNGNCTINNCYSTGKIGNESGGICGKNAGLNGKFIINNSYSIGSIGQYAGGICGKNAGSTDDETLYAVSTVNNCYSTGSIGEYGGGIYGDCAGNNGNCIVNNCFSTGDISSNAGGIFGANSANSGICFVNNSYSCGNISNNAGGIFGNNTGIVYVFNSYCNYNKVAGSVNANGSIYINNKDTSSNADVSFNLLGITKQIDFNTQDSSDINLDINSILYDCTYWDISNTWFSGGSASTGDFQYPKLLIYNTNESTKKLTIDSRLFKGLNETESNSARHKLLDKFYNEQTDDDNWFTDGTNLGFDINQDLIYKLYNTIDGSLNYNNSNEQTNIYINKLNINIEYEVYVNLQLYKITKTQENPNKYKLINPDNTEITDIIDGDLIDIGVALFKFGSLAIITNYGVGGCDICIEINNFPEIYKNKVFNNNGVLQFKWKPIEGTLYYNVNRYYGLCATPENSEKVTNVLYSDNTWDNKQSIIRYNVEAVFTNKIKTASNKVNYFNN
jgi:hypothetical protein